jgi:hypothetical protein
MEVGMRERMRRNDRGGVNFVQISLLASLIVACYFGYIFVPLWVDHYLDVRKVVRVACNTAYGGRVEAPVRLSVKKGFHDLGLQNETLNEDGTITTTQIELTDDNIDTLEIQKDPPLVTLEIHYTRTVVWPLLKKEHSYDFTSVHSESLEAIKY